MTHNTKLSGPRAWATVILLGGAALAAPFFRAPSKVTPQDPSAQVGLPNGLGQWPQISERSLEPQSPQAGNLSEEDWQALSRLQTQAGTATGAAKHLPTTAPTLPAWANRGARVDQLVDASLKSESLPTQAAAPAQSTAAYRPWVDPRLAHNCDPSAASSTSNLTNSSDPSSPQPFSSSPSLAGNDPWRDDSNWNAIGQPTQSVAVNKPAFETVPSLWPDETLRAGIRMPEPQYRDALVRNQASPTESPESAARPVALTSNGNPELQGQYNNRVQPRVGLSSSQHPRAGGGFPGQVLTPPAPVPQRKSNDKPERTRQFIQQPKKTT